MLFSCKTFAVNWVRYVEHSTLILCAIKMDTVFTSGRFWVAMTPYIQTLYMV